MNKKADFLYVNDDGQMRDSIVEKMFADLYNGTHEEEPITLENFNVYVQEIYNVDFTLKSFDDSAALIAFIAQVFGEHNYLTTGPDKYRIDFKSWRGKQFVQNSKLSLALALAIVLNMRNELTTRTTGQRRH